MKAFVLWENHAEGPIAKFGPHRFLASCVAARLGRNPFELVKSPELQGRSSSGNGGVVRDLRGQAVWDAVHLIAVLDTDKLHDLVGGPARKTVAASEYDAWSLRMARELRMRIGPHDEARLTFCFLDQNLETLLELLAGGPVKKRTVERDKLLARAAASPALIERAAAQMPTWGALVETVAQRIA